MAIRVEKYEGERSPYSATLSRRRGGEVGELEELFEELMGGEGLEDVEGLEDFDWDELWESFMEGEGGYEEGGVPQQASDRPTMFGAPIRPGGFRRPGGLDQPGYGMFY